ncbi:expressed protein [Chlorella variabilis]|uniref:Expressed protein n=1 Tax=Chlorella variabilis TaxID=554065 RepID=E1ZKV1_CHLVA|nr:expressed protein [Chlorella variabilis]EFN53444.1 expressed protein [Chlorella variabilis]|eukprot:XP_005845546.1 expressed protein [Chlorella variabilis]
MVEAADDSEIDAATHWIHQSTSLQQSALPPGARPPLGSRPPPLPRPKARRSKATRGPSSCRSSPCSSPSQQQDDSDYEDAVSDADAEWAAAAAALGRAPPEAGADSGSHQADSPDAPAYKRRRGSSGKAVKLRNPEYTEEELARKSRKRLQDKTLKSYDSHLRKLEAFCNIQGFTLAAAQDAMQVVTIMAKFIAWVANNMPCFNYRGKKESMSFGLLRAVRNAAVLKYNQLCISNGWSDARELMATREFKVEFMNGCALVLPKKGRPVGDPQKNTAAESLTDEEVMACFHWWLSQGDIASTRDWAANLACLKGIGRSDDTLPVYLADLAAPRPQKVIGEADCLVHRTVLRGGKRTAAGEVQWYDWIPASEPELCPVTAEAAYLALRFEIQQQPVPDISTKDGLLEFWSMPLYHGANFTAALHYEAHAAAVTKAATLYYEGHNGYPAWKDREEEQEQASQRGELGPQQSWRSGRRRTWHQFVRAMQLVEEVAKREQCTPIQAAKLVDQCLEARQVGKARKKSFACLGRSDKAESVRQMLGLPAKPESS